MRVGYKIYSLTTGNIYLMTGPYFWGMLVPGNSYGVVKLGGPQLFVVGRFLTDEGRAVVGYLKGATILGGDGGISSNREFALGAAYQITPPKDSRRFMVSLDLADARFQVVQANPSGNQTPQGIQLTSISIGVSTTL